MIRTALLWIPAPDDDVDAAIRALLADEGQFLVVRDGAAGHQRSVIEELLRRWSDEEELDLILTVGGTLPAPGPSGRECAPEATQAVLERAMPGLGETMRWAAGDVNRLASLDRGVAGIRGRTLIVNLPAGVDAAPLFLDAILHLIEPIYRHLMDDPSAAVLDDGFMDSEPEDPSGGGSHGLDADEFRAFLARRGDDPTRGQGQ